MITISTGSEINGDDDDVPDVEFFKPTLEYMGISWVCTWYMSLVYIREFSFTFSQTSPIAKPLNIRQNV